MVLALGAAVTFSNAVTLRQETQAAADAASLAATTAYANGTVTTAQDAEAIAQKFFNADAPPQAIASQTQFQAVTTVPTQSGQGTVSTAVTYSGHTNAIFFDLVHGSGMDIDVASTTKATVTVTSQASEGNVSGFSAVFGDPHILSVDGYNGYFDCPTGNWYDALSDYNIQINVACEPFYGTNWGYGAQSINKIAMVLGGHKILIDAGSVTCDTYTRICTYSTDVWTGKIEIDGVVFPAPTSAGQFTVLHDAAQNITVVDSIGAPGVAPSVSNGIYVYTPNYNLFIDFGDYDAGSIDVTAQNAAGACGTPGGFLGQTYGNLTDMTDTDFYESYMYNVNSQYSATCNTTSTSMLTSSHITQ
jgi:Flp pilus assembly protein TadG